MMPRETCGTLSLNDLPLCLPNLKQYATTGVSCLFCCLSCFELHHCQVTTTTNLSLSHNKNYCTVCTPKIHWKISRLHSTTLSQSMRAKKRKPARSRGGVVIRFIASSTDNFAPSPRASSFALLPLLPVIAVVSTTVHCILKDEEKVR